MAAATAPAASPVRREIQRLLSFSSFVFTLFSIFGSDVRFHRAAFGGKVVPGLHRRGP